MRSSLTNFIPRRPITAAWRAASYTTSIYGFIDSVTPVEDHFSKELNDILTVLATIPMIGVAAFFSNPAVISILALSYNYGKSYETLDANSEFNELSALGNGTVPLEQRLKTYQHIGNLFSAFSFGIAGTVINSMINSSIQSFLENQNSNEAYTHYFLEEAQKRCEATKNRLHGNAVFQGLPSEVRAVIATQIIPAFSAFNSQNDNQKELLATAAAIQFKKHNINFANDAVAANALAAVCDINIPRATTISDNIRANTPVPGLDMAQTTQLANTFQSRIEKRNASNRSR